MKKPVPGVLSGMVFFVDAHDPLTAAVA